MEPIRTRWVATAGMVLVLLMVMGFALDMALMGTTGGDPILRADSIGDDLVRAQGSAIWPVEGWVYTLMLLPATVFLAGIYWGFRRTDRDGGATIGVLLLFLFWVLHTVHNLAILVVVQGLAPGYVPGAADAAAIEATARAFVGLGDVLSPFSGLTTAFLATGLLALGRACLRPEVTYSRWTGYVALAVAPLAALGTLQGLSAAFLAPALIGWILFLLWNADLSVVLWKRSGPEAGADVDRASDAGEGAA